MATREIPLAACPNCGHRIDARSPLGGEASACPGDLTVCLGCAEVQVFDGALALRRPTPEEWAGLMRSDSYPKLERARLAILARMPVVGWEGVGRG